jgi:hypothetical protein
LDLLSAIHFWRSFAKTFELILARKKHGVALVQPASQMALTTWFWTTICGKVAPVMWNICSWMVVARKSSALQLNATCATGRNCFRSKHHS